MMIKVEMQDRLQVPTFHFLCGVSCCHCPGHSVLLLIVVACCGWPTAAYKDQLEVACFVLVELLSLIFSPAYNNNSFALIHISY